MRKITLLMALFFAFAWQSSAQITTYPYLEDFELGAGGWTVSGGLWALGTPSGATINSAGGGVNSWATNLSGNYSNNADTWVSSPVFDFTAVPNPYIVMDIWWHAENSWDGTVLQSSIDGGTTWQNVGALGDPGNWYTDGTINGNPGGQQTGWTGSPGSGGWVNASHDLTGLCGLASVTLRYAFGSDGSVNGFDGFAFDNINIVSITCPQPTALTATSVLDISADLAFTEAGAATSWNIEWGPAGFTPGTGTMVTGTGSNPYSLTGLTAITGYSYYVQADCGGGDLSFWSGPYTFLTACGLITPAWLDDVEAHAPNTNLSNSNCWNATSTSAYDWNVTGSGTTPSSNTGASAAHSGTSYFYIEASTGAAGNTATLTSPVLDASAMTIPTLKFWYHMTGNQIGTLNVEAWDGLAWNVVTTINGEQQGAQGDAFLEKTAYLPGYNNLGLQVRFIATGAGTYEGDICIDDISVTEAPTCPAPDPFSIVSSDLVSGTFDWTLTPISTETEWELEYGPMGFVPGNGTIMGTINNPETVGGLTPNSFYEIYVQSVCGVGDSSVLVGPLVFNTYNQGVFMETDNDCGPGFIDISNSGTALDLLYAGEMDYTMPFPFLYQNALVQNIAFASSGYIMLEAAPNQFSATFNQQVQNAIYWGLFPFWEAIEADFGNQYYETIGTPGNQTFIVQWDDNNYLNGPAGEIVTFQLQIDEATGEIYYIYDDVIFGGSDYIRDNGNSATIGVNGPNQNIQVSYNNATYLENNSCAHFYYTDCPKPTNFAVTYTTVDEGAVTWGSGLAGETNWTVIYGEAGFDPTMTGTSVNTSTPALIMPGLNDITCYDVYIYAECGPGLTSNGYMGTFCTDPNCANPTGISTATAVDTVMTDWAFTENLGFPSTGFGIQYGWSGFTVGTGTTSYLDNNLTDTTADMTLMGGGVYQMYVQAVCGTDSSAWVGPVSFTMPLTNDSTCFAEELAVDGTTYTFNNGGATIDVGETAITPPGTGCQTQTGWCNTNLNRSVWYTFVAPASGNVRVNCAGLTFDGQVAAYEVTDCNDFGTYTLVGANDDAPGGYNPPLMNLCGLTAGQTYYLMYDSFSTTGTGSYNITVTDVIVEAGTDNGLTSICRGDVADLFDNITGYDLDGVWSEDIPTATFNDPFFATNGLASQVFGFEYVVIDGCASDTVATTVEIFSPSSAGVDGTISTCMNQPISLLQGLSGNVDLGGSWYDPSNSLLQDSDIIASAIPGQFNYDYVTGNGVCPDDTANVVVIVDLNCDYLNLQALYFDGMDLHPNPTTGMVYISNAGSTEVFNLELTDLNGKVIATQNGSINGTETTELSLGNIETGIYLIRIFNDNAEKTFRIVKQ